MKVRWLWFLTLAAATAAPSLRADAPFPVGVAYCLGKRNPRTNPIIDGQFSRLTSTEFYSFLLWKGPGRYHFQRADQSVEEVHKSGRTIHAHCLLYALESVSPEFLVKFEGSSQEFEALVRDYLTTTLAHYRGRVRSYDLANELYEYNGPGLQKSWMRKHFGSDQEFLDFIGRCYSYAHAADPEALLFYADCGQEFSTQNYAKGWAIAHQLLRWKRQGVPIHGYALQFHTNIYRPQQDIEEALRLAAKTGLQIYISELDVSLNWADPDAVEVRPGKQGVREASPDLLEKQSQIFRNLARTYRRVVPKRQQFGITVWDIGDADSWLATQRFERPTLFDLEYRPKPAYYGFLQGLKEP